MPRIQAGLVLMLLLFAHCLLAADAPDDKADVTVQLPQKHEYQRVLRRFMATLKEEDFKHGVTELITAKPSSQDPEYQYRNYVMTLMQQPLVGTKRGTPAVNAPARLFTLSEIEGPKAVRVPPVWPEALIAFVEWDYPGNVYRDNKALKLRAFVTACIHMMMLDAHLDKTPTLHRSDWLGYQLVMLAAPYPGFKDLLPADVQEAYLAGLRRRAEFIMQLGPKREEPNLDMTVPIGLWYVSRLTEDRDFDERVENYARMMFANPKYFHPAGYFLERGGVDMGFQGMANYFAIWAALATDWEFADKAVDNIYRLRAHLSLPEPDGTWTGPTHFNNRLGTPVSVDQWHWDGAREHAAAMATDEAVHLIKLPAPDELKGAADKRAGMFAFQIKQNIRVREKGKLRHLRNEEINSRPWQWRMWQTWNFPVTVNPGYSFYPEGAYARLSALAKEGSPYLKSPFRRDGVFVRNFADAFVAVNQDAYSAVLHTGPVGRQRPDDGLFQFKGPLGFGGGQLSAFSTGDTGAVLLGRRSGMNWDKNFDKVEDWRLWPIHSVSGRTTEGKVFTAARIRDPLVTCEIHDDSNASVVVSGKIPKNQLQQENVLKGDVDYKRTFRIRPNGIRVETSIETDGKDELAELYETLPVFHREGGKLQGKDVAATITFQVGGQWKPATEKVQQGVTAVRLQRFDGTVQITFDSAQSLKLSPVEWKGAFLATAVCRNILIDLLSTEKPRLAYTIQPAQP